MGIQLAHNKRILKIALKFIFFASWICSVKFAFFSNVLCGKWAWHPPDHATCLSVWLLIAEIKSFPADVSFVTVLATILSEYWKKLEEIFFFKWYYFEESVKIVSFWKKISSLFQYSETTVASTVTNDTSAESSWSQLLGARQTWAWHDQEGVTPTCRKGHWKKKQIWRSKVRMQKKIFLT